MSTLPQPAHQKKSESQPARGLLHLTVNRFDLVVPPSAFDLEGFRAWVTADGFPDHVRVSFVDGEVFLDMSNEEFNAHVAVKTEVFGVLGPLVKKENLGKFYADGGLVTCPDAGVSNNPDALFLSLNTIETRKARLVPRKGAEHLYREVEGPPDWVLEVVSDSSVKKDTQRLRQAYHKAGVAEYWLIDARGDELVFSILSRRKNDFAAATNNDGWQRSKVFARSFRLRRELDDFGLWEYTLDVQ